MASASTGKEAECKDYFIDIPPHLPPAEWPECCIYRVPKKLRMVNEEAYTPKLVSIGPFHHHINGSTDMEMHKMRYLKDFFDQTERSQEGFLKIIKDNEVKIRHCYSETIEHNSNDFVKMILLDAIFIIELFSRNDRNDGSDYILSKPWLRLGITHDLMLLENQLPFFILEKLYMLAFDLNDSSSFNHHEEDKQIEEHKKDPFFVKLCRNYFKDYDHQPDSIIGKEIKHFTDLVRFLLCSVPNLHPKEHFHTRYCATKLDDAGLKFKAVNKRLLDITFAGNKCLGHFPCCNMSWLLACLPCLKGVKCLERMQSILEVPIVVIDDSTEAVFRNLIALEQCHYPSETYICNYAVLLDYLIDNEKDVELLVDKNVIVNNIGSNAAVAALINGLCLQIVEDNSCYSDLGKQINEYSDNHLNRIMATMKSEFFRDFWRGTATTVALVVLLYQFWSFLRPFVFKK
ncbi:UPF0481 protein At3g47200-like [Corylus avellana]|uniref:UPF0481 protein At3g47200-like n=1 Tax=Corylus avellana TaxID=13451 RepID=UPI001E20349B|nr:UPF0481 protein At3g47200-like [Corylus avellana]